MRKEPTYHEELAAAPKRDVDRDEFERCARLAGWDEQALTVFLKYPLCKGFVLVGDEGLRIAKPSPGK